MIDFDVHVDAEQIANAGELYKGRVHPYVCLNIATSEQEIASIHLHSAAKGKNTRYHFRISPFAAKTSKLELGVYLFEKKQKGLPAISTVGGSVRMQVHLAGFEPKVEMEDEGSGKAEKQGATTGKIENVPTYVVVPVPKLVEALEDEKSSNRREAIKALVRIAPKKAAAAFLKLAGDKDEFKRRDAVFAFGLTAGDETLTAILQALKDPEEIVRDEAVNALRRRRARSERVIAALIAALMDDKSPVYPRGGVFPGGPPSVWDNVIELLRGIGPPAIARLNDALKDEDAEIRMRAVECLITIAPGQGAIRPTLLEVLEQGKGAGEG